MALAIDNEFLIPAKLPGPLLTYNADISFILKFLEFKKSFIKIVNFS